MIQMGGRYIVTGAELGILIATPDQSRRSELVDEIIAKGYLCDDIPIEELVKQLRPLKREEYIIHMMALMLGDDIEVDGKMVRSLKCFDAQQMLFIIMKRLEEQGIKLIIPYYWSTHGIRIELNQLVEMYPKIKWTCYKHEFENCPYKLECDFKGKYMGQKQEIVKKSQGVWEGCGHKVRAVILDNNPFSVSSHLGYLENNPKNLCHECWLKDNEEK